MNRRMASRTMSCSSDHSYIATSRRRTGSSAGPVSPGQRLIADRLQSWRATDAQVRGDPVRAVGRPAVLRRPGRALLRGRGHRPAAAPHVPGRPGRLQGPPGPLPRAVLGRARRLQPGQGSPPPADAARPVRDRPGRGRGLDAPHDRRRRRRRHGARRPEPSCSTTCRWPPGASRTPTDGRRRPRSARSRPPALPGGAEHRAHGRLERGVVHRRPGAEHHGRVVAYRHPQRGVRVLDARPGWPRPPLRDRDGRRAR